MTFLNSNNKDQAMKINITNWKLEIKNQTLIHLRVYPHLPLFFVDIIPICFLLSLTEMCTCACKLLRFFAEIENKFP